MSHLFGGHHKQPEEGTEHQHTSNPGHHNQPTEGTSGEGHHLFGSDHHNQPAEAAGTEQHQQHHGLFGGHHEETQAGTMHGTQHMTSPGHHPTPEHGPSTQQRAYYHSAPPSDLSGSDPEPDQQSQRTLENMPSRHRDSVRKAMRKVKKDLEESGKRVDDYHIKGASHPSSTVAIQQENITVQIRGGESKSHKLGTVHIDAESGAWEPDVRSYKGSLKTPKSFFDARKAAEGER